MNHVWRWLGLPTLLGLLLVTAGLAPLGSSGVRHVAEQFQPPADATTYQTRVTAKRFVCLGASPCPSLFKSWTLERRLDLAELEALVATAGWTLQSDGDCRPRPQSFARVTLCSAVGEVDGYAVTVSLRGEGRTEHSILALDVRPPS